MAECDSRPKIILAVHPQHYTIFCCVRWRAVEGKGRLVHTTGRVLTDTVGIQQPPSLRMSLGGRSSVTASIMTAYLSSLTKIPHAISSYPDPCSYSVCRHISWVQDEITSGLSHYPRSDKQLNGLHDDLQGCCQGP